MSDLLGSILDNMISPPVNKDKDAIKRRKALKRKREEDVRKRSVQVKGVQKEVEEFVNGTEKEFTFKPSEKEWRAIQHEMAEIAGLISVSCYNGPDQEKHVTAFKKESCPPEKEIRRRRLGVNYIEDYNKAVPVCSNAKSSETPIVPSRNYQDKYKKFLNTSEVKGDVRQFHGLVPVHMLCSESKSIEDSLNEIRNKKRLKTENKQDNGPSSSTNPGP